MEVNTQLQIIYHIEGLLELLRSTNMVPEKEAAINQLIDEEIIRLAKLRKLPLEATIKAAPQVEFSTAFAEESDVNDIPHMTESVIMHSEEPEDLSLKEDEREIADNAEFEEAEDADVNDNEIIEPSESIIAKTTDESWINHENDSIQQPGIHDSSNPTTVNSAMLRNRSRKDLKSAFTLNDRFRFCRELFGNSQSEFQSAIAYANTLDNYADAENYFVKELDWNPENTVVTEFLEIIKSVLS